MSTGPTPPATIAPMIGGEIPFVHEGGNVDVGRTRRSSWAVMGAECSAPESEAAAAGACATSDARDLELVREPPRRPGCRSELPTDRNLHMASGYLQRRSFTPPVDQLDPRKHLPFQPRNENGVVFVFARVAEQLGFTVEKVQAGFPDCTAIWGGRKARIEFEFRSRNFERHGHDPNKCDLVVCWRHDWPGMPVGLAPLELRKIFGLAREVFMVAYRDEFWQRLPQDREPAGLWSVPASAGPDDLLLVYRPAMNGQQGAVTDVFRVVTPPQRVKKTRWSGEPDWMAEIQRVVRLKTPIPFSRLESLGAHGGIESRPRRTKQWPALYREIIKNGDPSHSLKRYETL
jgi:hypothetical protein